MSQLEPQSGAAPSSNDAGRAQEGNRPANNARRSTPGSLSTQGYQSAGEVDDFLGLDAEMGSAQAPQSAFELMSEPAQAPAHSPREAFVTPQPQAETYDDELESQSEQPYGSQPDLDAGAERDFDATEDQTGEAQDDSPHASWQEEAPRRSGTGRLVGMAVGTLVVAMLGMAGYKFMGATGTGAIDVSEPLAARGAPRADARTQLAAPETDAAVEDVARMAFDAEGSAQLTDPRPEFAQEPGAAGEQAREAFDSARGNEPPTWFDPSLDSKAEPVETGWSPEAEAVTQAVNTPKPILADMDAIAAATQSDSAAGEAAAGDVGSAEPLARDAGAPDVLELVGSDAVVEPEAAVAVGANAGAQEYDVAALISLKPPVAAARGAGAPPVPGSATAASAPAPAVATAPVGAISGAPGAAVGPLPAADSTGVIPADGAVAALNQSRQSRTSTLKVEDVLLAPTMDQSNLRPADAKDLAGVWSQSGIPMEAIDSKTKVLTPTVGRVRVLLKSKDIFEGRLVAVGQGNVWIENESGRIAVSGARIASVAQLDSKEGTPELGASGSQDLAGMARVRVKTPGGTFYGKVIARDDSKTTLITDDGARLTLDSKDVEFLTDAPRVSIRGKVEDKGGKP